MGGEKAELRFQLSQGQCEIARHLPTTKYFDDIFESAPLTSILSYDLTPAALFLSDANVALALILEPPTTTSREPEPFRDTFLFSFSICFRYFIKFSALWM